MKAEKENSECTLLLYEMEKHLAEWTFIFSLSYKKLHIAETWVVID